MVTLNNWKKEVKRKFKLNNNVSFNCIFNEYNNLKYCLKGWRMSSAHKSYLLGFWYLISFLHHGRLARWRKWRACEGGEAKGGLENELWRRWCNGRVGEWAVTWVKRWKGWRMSWRRWGDGKVGEWALLLNVTYWASRISSIFYIMGGSSGDVSEEPVT